MLIRYKTEEAVVDLCKDLDSLLFIKFNEPVMRHTHVKLSETEYSAEYIKPEPMTTGISSAHAAPKVEVAVQEESVEKEEAVIQPVETAASEEAA